MTNDEQARRRRFPIMGQRHGDICMTIPWEIISPHQSQAMKNHSQTLERLAERGGLSPGEALAVMTNRAWQDRSKFKFHETLDALIEVIINRLSEPTEEMKLAGARSIRDTMGMPNHTQRAAECFYVMMNTGRNK